MLFIFDLGKSAETKRARGIDFAEAQALWGDLLGIDVPARITGGEERWLKIGKIGGKIWTACFTYRGNAVRIISVRPARRDEREAYGEQEENGGAGGGI
jgi:hypothetical protein